ncbi:MAG: hypothetical protein ACTHMM_05395 [Agriterribacter sp.]
MKQLIASLTILVFAGCMTNYPMTTVYVKNNSNKTLNFKASIVKYSSMGGPFEMTLPFTVLPHDSVVARRVGLKNGALPTVWFTSFNIFPTDSVSFNDPNNAANWIRSTDTKGKPVYTFIMTK